MDLFSRSLINLHCEIEAAGVYRNAKREGKE